ncbi:MAG: hypothetical protein M0002_18320 [Rhodospirillales bacterium]|nr:hypothetical protein [Rhodospirillales bacterium]
MTERALKADRAAFCDMTHVLAKEKLAPLDRFSLSLEGELPKRPFLYAD